MCGISGIISLSDKYLSAEDERMLHKMLRRMEYRGPDGSDFKLFDLCHFGMVRLAIIDVLNGQQPICNESGDVWVVMNGEIYNYIELRDELLKGGHIFKTNSDTEVLVHLYEEFGEKFVDKLNGMFAIFLYDKKNGKTYLFRDHMGIKPLFFSISNNKLFFSSDLSGLAEILDSKVSEDAISSFLGLSYVPNPNSIYENIHKLMPGHLISISEKNNINFIQYWKPAQNIFFKNYSLNSYKENLHKLLLDSVTIQLRSDVGFAISLSGGIDSSLILAYASLSGHKEINTISMSFEEKKSSNDMNYAELISKKYSSNHFNFKLNKSLFLESIDEIIPRIDEPISDSAIIPNYIISKEAKKLGFKVLLSGAGGDEIFNGYNRYLPPSIFSAKGLLRFPNIIKKLSYNFLSRIDNNNNIERLINEPLTYASDVNGLNYSFLKKILYKEKYESLTSNVLDEYFDLNMDKTNYAKKRMLNDSSNYLVNNILSLSDKSTMAASVEGRFPIIDYRIVDFAFSSDNSFIFQNSKPKDLLKQVVGKYLPQEILNRPKEGFNAPIEQWFGPNEIQHVKSYIIDSSKKNLSNFINVDLLKSMLNSNLNEAKIFENIFNLYFLNKWMDHHVK